MKKPTIRELREKKGLVGPELAVLARVSKSTLWYMESGVPVGAVFVNRVCNALGVDIADVSVEVLPPLAQTRKELKLKRMECNDEQSRTDN